MKASRGIYVKTKEQTKKSDWTSSASFMELNFQFETEEEKYVHVSISDRLDLREPSQARPGRAIRDSSEVTSIQVNERASRGHICKKQEQTKKKEKNRVRRQRERERELCSVSSWWTIFKRKKYS